MRAIAPRTGAPEETIAEDQHEFVPLTVAIYVHAGGDYDGMRELLTRWTMTKEERERIAAGEDIYIGQLNGAGFTPLIVQVGAAGYINPQSPDDANNPE